MTYAKQYLLIIEENFDASDMHPAEIEAILTKSYEEYQELNPGIKTRRLMRNAYNQLVDLLEQKRGFRQFNYLK